MGDVDQVAAVDLLVAEVDPFGKARLIQLGMLGECAMHCVDDEV